VSRVGLGTAVGAVFLVGVLASILLFRAGEPGRRHGARAAPGAGVELASLVLRPASAFFGQTVTADASVLIGDVDVDVVAIRSDFRPYSVVGSRRERRGFTGHRTMLRLRWTLQCLRTQCLAPDGVHANYTFPVSVSAPGLKTARTAFPPLLVVSRLANGNAAMRNEVLLARQRRSSTPSAAVLSLAALGLVGMAAMLLLVPARRAVVDRRGVAPRSDDGLRAAIERAEARRVAVSRTEQRGALDHLARVIAGREPELAGELRALAWSRTDPDDAAIDRLLRRARGLVR
jgi:hypothetical protein